jgi:hypothetical protein
VAVLAAVSGGGEWRWWGGGSVAVLAAVLLGLYRRSELVISILVRLFDFVDDFVCQFVG